MAIVGADTVLKKISSQIDSQFPGFIREEGPQFVAFMKAYFEYLEQNGKAVNAARSIKDNQDIDRTVDSFVEYFRKQFMVNIPKEVLADKRLLTKHIREFYRSRGSQESYRFLFRALFNAEIEFYYPGDDILRASDGRWVRETKLRVGAPFSINPESLGGVNVTGVTSGARALVQSVTATIASGLTLYDMVVENISGSFVDGERVVNSEGNFVTVSAQVGPLINVGIQNGGAYHNIGDIIEIGGAGSTLAARGVVTETRNTGGGVEASLIKGGTGYTLRNAKLIVTGGNGTGFEAKVASWVREPIPTTLSIDTINPIKDVRLDTGPYFVATGANTAITRQQLLGTVKLSSGSNTIVGQGTNFVDQLNVGDIVRVVGSANTLRVHSISTAQTFVSAIAPTTTITVGANYFTGLAGANIYSSIQSALSFSANNYYLINAIAIINPGFGYTVLPTITIVDSEVSTFNVPDGYGGYLGKNAVVTVRSAPGSIKSMRITSGGQNFNRFDSASLTNFTQGNSAIVKTIAGANISGGATNRFVRTKRTFAGAAIPIPSGVVTFPGRYVDTKGFLSWNNRLQDNYYYQEFSYVLRVSEMLEKYRNIVKRVLHPAGTKQFNELVINSSANTILIVATTYSDIFNDVVSESITATDTVVGRSIRPAVIGPESVTATDALPLAQVSKNVGMMESVAADDSFAATYNSGDLTSGAESVTSTEIVDGRTDSVILNSGIESITSTDTVVGNNDIGNVTSGTESITSTDTVVGEGVTSATSGIESVTSTDTVNGTTNSVILNSGTESVTSTDTTEGLVLLGAQIFESITPTDTVVGSTTLPVTISEQNGEITPYAATQITVYELSNVEVLVTPFLNLDDIVN